MEITEDKISISHLNIRPSISILLIQLIFLNILTEFIIISIFTFVNSYQFSSDIFINFTLELTVIIVVFTLQIFLTVFGILQWLNNYYEISAQSLVHKKGIIFRRVEKFKIEHIKYIDLNQGVLGKILNYGTISFYDQRREKFMDLYLIHNPTRYLEIFEKINPDIDEVESIIGN